MTPGLWLAAGVGACVLWLVGWWVVWEIVTRRREARLRLVQVAISRARLEAEQRRRDDELVAHLERRFGSAIAVYLDGKRLATVVAAGQKLSARRSS